MVWYSHFFQNFQQFIVIHRVKGFGIVNKAEIDVFLELSCFFDALVQVYIHMQRYSDFWMSVVFVDECLLRVVFARI